MNEVLFALGPYPVTTRAALAAALGVLVLTMLRAWAVARRGRAQALARQSEVEARMNEIGRASAELAGRVQAMGEAVGARQADLARMIGERLDSVGARVGLGLETSAKTTGESLNKLNERLAVIDAAQSRLVGLTQEMVSLKDILANKQTRGAFGQGRMEAIVRDGLPPNAYDFQFTLSNKMRPDCVVRLPGDTRLMVVDAKFPLEAFALLKDARSDEARRAAQARVRADIGTHVKAIAERYLIAGETQEPAVMFVPSESIYSDLIEHFDDVMQKAHRARVMIVSPSLLMMAIQLMRSALRDQTMREQAHLIQAEVGRLLEDARRLVERAGKLDTHFRQAQDDLGALATSVDKVARRGERILAMEFSKEEAQEPAPPRLRLAEGGE